MIANLQLVLENYVLIMIASDPTDRWYKERNLQLKQVKGNLLNTVLNLARKAFQPKPMG